MADADYEYDLFISYNHVDEAWAAQLAYRLEREDHQGRKLKVFFASWDISPGESIPERLEEALPKSRKVGLVMTPEAMASEWVKRERLVTHHIAISEREKRLIPLLRRTCPIPALLRDILPIDFRDDVRFETSCCDLLAAVRDERPPRVPHHSMSTQPTIAPDLPRPPVIEFVARHDREGRDLVTQMTAELSPPNSRVIALHGAGGLGKTTLAREVARRLSGVFDGRIVWASAEGKSDFTLSTLLDAIAATLGQDDARRLALEAKKDAVRALLAEKPAMVVLDNFETIAPDEQTACADWLAHGAASTPALMTTRDRVSQARNVPLGGLSPAEAREFVARWVEQAQNPDAFASRHDAIIKEADANPLALQWMLAQIDDAGDPDTVLQELAHGKGTAAERIFNRSFDLPQLTDDGRAALLALSLFVPSATRPALAEVAGFGADLPRLNAAVQRVARLCLLRVTAAQRLSVDGLTRQLAQAHLSKDPRVAEFRQRYIAHFLRYAEAHSQPMSEDFDALQTEKDNILGAMDIAFEMRDWLSVMRVNTAIGMFYAGFLGVRGYWEEAIQRSTQAAESARATQDEATFAAFSCNVAAIRLHRGEYDVAQRIYRQARIIFQNIGNAGNVAVVLQQMGVIAQEQGDLAKARQFYIEGLRIAKQIGNQSSIADFLHHLGIITHQEGSLAEARHLYAESQEIFKGLNDQNGIASTRHQLGMIAYEEGNLAEAKQLYAKSLEFNEQLGDKKNIAISLLNLGVIAQEQGNLSEARRLFTESLEVNKQLSRQSGMASCLHNLGEIEGTEGNKVEAARLLREALTIFEKLGSPTAEKTRRNLARVESSEQ